MGRSELIGWIPLGTKGTGITGGGPNILLDKLKWSKEDGSLMGGSGETVHH